MDLPLRSRILFSHYCADAQEPGMSFKFVRPLVVAFVGVSIDACSGSSTPDTALAANKLSVANTAASPMIVTATIKELMDSTVDPAADGLWEAVSTSYTFEG